MDAATTLWFLHSGVHEANPLVRAALAASGRPGLVLAADKLVAVGLAVCAWRRGRTGLLGKMNLLFAAIVAWNLAAIFVAGGR